MICGNRRSTIAALNTSIETAYLIDVSHRFHAFRLTGVIDDSLLHQPFLPTRILYRQPALTILLRGHLLARFGSERRWLEPGEGYVMRPHADLSWRMLGGCHGLTFAWHGPATDLPEETFFKISPEQLTRIERATDAMFEKSNCERAMRVHHAAIDALRSTQLVPARVFETTPCDPAYQALMMAVDARLSNLADEPMQVELQDELGISERHLRRLTSEVFKRYGLVDANWGKARARRRLSTAVAFMGNPAATVSLVAQQVGYHSTQAMARAFARAGFPAPSRIRATLDQLAER